MPTKSFRGRWYQTTTIQRRLCAPNLHSKVEQSLHANKEAAPAEGCRRRERSYKLMSWKGLCADQNRSPMNASQADSKRNHGKTSYPLHAQATRPTDRRPADAPHDGPEWTSAPTPHPRCTRDSYPRRSCQIHRPPHRSQEWAHRLPQAPDNHR